jgi:hypothetical protein
MPRESVSAQGLSAELSVEPSAGLSADLYDHDYVQWLTEVVKCLKYGTFDQLGSENLQYLLAELEAMGRSEKRAIESNLRVLLLHLLKWSYHPQRRSRSWQSSIQEHRIRIRKALRDSPSLNNYLSEVFAETYEDASVLAACETGLSKDAFQRPCPWSLNQVLEEHWLP